MHSIECQVKSLSAWKGGVQGQDTGEMAKGGLARCCKVQPRGLSAPHLDDFALLLDKQLHHCNLPVFRPVLCKIPRSLLSSAPPPISLRRVQSWMAFPPFSTFKTVTCSGWAAIKLKPAQVFSAGLFAAGATRCSRSQVSALGGDPWRPVAALARRRLTAEEPRSSALLNRPFLESKRVGAVESRDGGDFRHGRKVAVLRRKVAVFPRSPARLPPIPA